MKTINFTAAYWKDIASKIYLYKELRFLVESIKIMDFTDKLESILIIFQAFPRDYPARKVEAFQKMRRKTKTLELYLVVDYERMLSASDAENLQHLKEVFLAGCETFLKKRKDLDWEAFDAAIKKEFVRAT